MLLFSSEVVYLHVLIHSHLSIYILLLSLWYTRSIVESCPITQKKHSELETFWHYNQLPYTDIEITILDFLVLYVVWDLILIPELLVGSLLYVSEKVQRDPTVPLLVTSESY